MTLKELLHRRDDALMEILDRLKGKLKSVECYFVERRTLLTEKV